MAKVEPIEVKVNISITPVADVVAAIREWLEQHPPKAGGAV